MSYDSYSQDYSRRLRALGRRLDDAERELGSLRDRLGDVEDLDYELRRIEENADHALREISALDTELRGHKTGTSRSLKKLTARVQALEALARTAEDAPVADLDTADPEWTRLAATAQRGRQARASLLTAAERGAHEHTVQRHLTALEQRRACQLRVVGAAGVLASTARTDQRHIEAAAEFTRSLAQEERLKYNEGKLAADGSEARAALRRDDTNRQKKKAAIDAGEEGASRLAGLLRNHLASAIRDRALLPMWFVTVLGPVPPAEATGKWLDTAVDVLAYRLTYGITDDALALGTPPTDDTLRIAWHQELTKNLRAWA